MSEILHAAFSGELSPNQNIHSSIDPLAKAVSEIEEARNLLGTVTALMSLQTLSFQGRKKISNERLP